MSSAPSVVAHGPPGPMSERVRQRLRQVTHELTGIVLGPDKDTLLSSRVQKRLRALKLTSYDEYLAHFERDPDEVQQFINVITTNTTAFWREPAHFHAAREVFDEWSRAGQRKFRIWIAASSTGQEPWTLALTLAPLAESRYLDIAILATDIDTRVLSVAAAATYDADLIEPLPPEVRANGFERLDDGRVRVVERVRRMVRFARLNLSTPPFPMKGPLDLIMCRNVMIYLDLRTRQRLVAESERLLKPGGLLMLGHSESALGLARVLEMTKPSIWRKPTEPT